MGIKSFTFDKRLINKFVNFGNLIYKKDKNFVSPFKKKLINELSGKNNFFKSGKMINFIYEKNNRIVGRISAMINKDAKINNKYMGYLGFFECVDDYDIAKKLIDAGISFIKENKLSSVIAPINFSTWNKYRFITSHFENRPFLMEPYNLRYYHEFFKKYGFSTMRKYYSMIIDDLEIEKMRFNRVKDRFYKSGYYIRRIDINNIEKELRLLYELTIMIFNKNWAYTEISFEEFFKLYDGIEKIIAPDCCLFAYTADNKPIGYLFGIPDYSAAMRSMGGNSNIISKIGFVLNKNRKDIFILKTIGVLPEFRSAGVGGALISTMHEYAYNNGYKKAIHALMIEDNASRKYSQNSGKIYREYEILYKGI